MNELMKLALLEAKQWLDTVEADEFINEYEAFSSDCGVELKAYSDELQAAILASQIDAKKPTYVTVAQEIHLITMFGCSFQSVPITDYSFLNTDRTKTAKFGAANDSNYSLAA
jgi:hypothetical protein